MNQTQIKNFISTHEDQLENLSQTLESYISETYIDNNSKIDETDPVVILYRALGALTAE